MAKKGFLLVLMCCSLLLANNVLGQDATQIPPFKLLRSNGRFFNSSELPKNKPVLLIYFAPDCGHCLDLLTPFFKQIDRFRETEIVLATFKPVSELTLFERSYKTAAYPNLVVGTEGNTFYLRNYFKMQKTPFVALYDSKGKLAQTFSNEPTVAELLNSVQKLR